MKIDKKSLIIASILSIGFILYFTRKKEGKTEIKSVSTNLSTDYTDAELDKMINKTVDEMMNYEKAKNPSKSSTMKSKNEAFNSIKAIIDKHKASKKDMSKKTIDNFLSIVKKQTRTSMGDNSLGKWTEADQIFWEKF
jgi:hypothetical protein